MPKTTNRKKSFLGEICKIDSSLTQSRRKALFCNWLATRDLISKAEAVVKEAQDKEQEALRAIASTMGIGPFTYNATRYSISARSNILFMKRPKNIGLNFDESERVDEETDAGEEIETFVAEEIQK